MTNFRSWRAQWWRGVLCVLAGVDLLAAIPAARAAAEDLVYLKPRAAGDAPTRMRGEVVDYTGRRLVLKSAGGREQSIPADRVERVATQYSGEQRTGDQLFADGDFQEALAQYRLALAAAREPRDWVRRQILAQVVWCLRNLNQADQAGEYFLILLSRDAETRDFDCLPLAWTDAPPPAAVVDKARGWLANSENPAAMLMGASFLLAGPERAAAQTQLERLARDADPRIAWLARAQLWRLAVDQTGDDKLGQWAEAIAAQDPQLRAGAYFLLGRALAGRHPEDAAIVLMRLPIDYPREDALAAEALLAAGECLERLDRPEQAARLYRELAQRHATTPAADEGRRRFARLSATGPARDN